MMIGRRFLVAWLAVCVPATPALAAHDREFWRGIVGQDYRVPDGESAVALLEELNGYLGSPDPELRDEFAYSIPAAWIYRDQRLTAAELNAFRTKWTANLTVGVGTIGSDTLLLRSFSALDLSLLAALDTKHEFLGRPEFGELLTAAVDYMNAERDLRGWEPDKGWFHATAHTADLLKFLGRNGKLAVADQGRILDAIAGKLAASGHAFGFGENERLARAVESLVLRPDFDAARFEAFLAPLPGRSKAVWDAARLDPTEFAALQNAKDLLRTLFTDLAQAEHLAPAAEAARSQVLRCLKGML